jgi:four helix bundle protein
MGRSVIQNIRDLDVYNLSYALALEVFSLSRKFPKEETYSLTDQIRRSSRSIPANISEGFAKRRYENIFDIIVKNSW